MDYKRKKYLQQKLHLEHIQLNYKFFIIIQLKSMHTSEWASMANEMSKYNFKAKSFSTKLLQRDNSFIPEDLAKICLHRSQKIYNGKIVVLYPINANLTQIEQVLSLLEKSNIAIPLFAFVDKRFINVSLLKKIVNEASDVNSAKIVMFLLFHVLSIINTLKSINKQKDEN